MGTEVVSADQNDSKQQMTVATVVAASVAIGAGEMVVWIGNLLGGRNMEVITALERCRDAIREFGAPDPANTFEIIALTQPGAPKSAVVITNQAALPTITEDDVLVGYGETYVPGAGGSTKLLLDRIDAAINVLMESTLKAA